MPIVNPDNFTTSRLSNFGAGFGKGFGDTIGARASQLTDMKMSDIAEKQKEKRESEFRKKRQDQFKSDLMASGMSEEDAALLSTYDQQFQPGIMKDLWLKRIASMQPGAGSQLAGGKENPFGGILEQSANAMNQPKGGMDIMQALGLSQPGNIQSPMDALARNVMGWNPQQGMEMPNAGLGQLISQQVKSQQPMNPMSNLLGQVAPTANILKNALLKGPGVPGRGMMSSDKTAFQSNLGKIARNKENSADIMQVGYDALEKYLGKKMSPLTAMNKAIKEAREFAKGSKTIEKKSGKMKLSEAKASEYLAKAKGNRDQARKLAKKDGYDV